MQPSPHANSNDMLHDLNKLNAMLAAKGMALPPEWGMMTPEQKQNFLNEVQQDAQQATQIGEHVQDFVGDEQQNVKDMSMMSSGLPAPSFAKKRLFNLKKFSQMEPPMADPMADPMAGQGNPMGQGQSPAPQQAGGYGAMQPEGSMCPDRFADAGQLYNCLRGFRNDPNKAIKFFAEKYTNSNQMVLDPNNQQRTDEALAVVKDTLNDFYSTDDPSVQMKAAQTIFDTILPDSAKAQTADQQQPVMSMVLESNEVIKKLAQQHAAKSKKATGTFNLKKEAQHQSVHNVMLFGPNQNKIDTFTGQLINDWHLVERNKGFGLKVDDVLDIDFEPIWRNTVMDKFYRPYRANDGSWQGGYLENRFEIDKNIPVLNNMQLKPGEKRKPILPEYGNIGSRLEAKRNEMNKDRGYKPSTSSKPFNWNKASAQDKVIKTAEKPVFNLSQTKKKVTSQFEPPKNDGLKLPGDAPNRSVSKNPICPFCGGNLGKTENNSTPGMCSNCGARVPNPMMQNPQAPAMGVPTQAVSPSQRLSSTDGIFFDGKKFIVYANANRVAFNTFDEAEHFKMQPSVEATSAPAPAPAAPVQDQLDPREREKYDVADKLGIDG